MPRTKEELAPPSIEANHVIDHLFGKTRAPARRARACPVHHPARQHEWHCSCSATRMTRTAKLSTYRGKRDFERTPEPSGTVAKLHAGHGFVIQKHAARRLHYDFRLELDGVLLSWAVPKGPSLQPRDRRLAVRVEDHPLDYAGFEGTIPAGQYGGGSVVVWDRGTWQPEGDARASLARGKLAFTLDGEKLHGRWHLVRTKPQGTQDAWLLFKGRDDAASDTVDIVEAEPESVLSGRTIEQVAAAPERVWHSDRADKVVPPKAHTSASSPRSPKVAGGPRGPRAPSPEVGKPGNVAALVTQLPLSFELTNLDKVLYPEDGITKAQLVAYLAVAAERMLPHVANRPLTLVRHPNGRAAKGFFQKHRPKGTPDELVALELEGDDEPWMILRDMPGLVAAAQLGSLELHTWGCRAPDVEHPDVLVLDLDPDPGLPWDRVVAAAIEVRRRLHAAGLESFVKTTGGKGLHVVAPIARGAPWDQLREFTKAFAARLEHDEPAGYTSNMAKAQRKGRIFVDYLRNVRGATFVAPYSPRAREHAPVATPITWEELAGGVQPSSFTMITVPERIARIADPWAAYATLKQKLPRTP